MRIPLAAAVLVLSSTYSVADMTAPSTNVFNQALRTVEPLSPALLSRGAEKGVQTRYRTPDSFMPVVRLPQPGFANDISGMIGTIRVVARDGTAGRSIYSVPAPVSVSFDWSSFKGTHPAANTHAVGLDDVWTGTDLPSSAVIQSTPSIYAKRDLSGMIGIRYDASTVFKIDISGMIGTQRY